MISEQVVEEQVKQLLKEVIDLYQANRQKKRIGTRIFRGRAASIADSFEEKFAKLLDAVLPDRYSIFVDYPLSYKTPKKSRTKTSYPDLAIIEEGRLLAGIIELKIDLGYLPQDWVKRTSEETDYLRRTKVVSYKTNIGTDKAEKKQLEVKSKIPRAIVVLTGQNDHGRLKSFLKQPDCFVLSKDIHPAEYWINENNLDTTIDNILKNAANIKEWQAFANFLKEHFS